MFVTKDFILTKQIVVLIKALVLLVTALGISVLLTPDPVFAVGGNVASMVVRIEVLPWRTIVVDEEDTIIKVYGNATGIDVQKVSVVRENYLHISMTFDIQRQYNELLYLVNWNTPGVFYERSIVAPDPVSSLLEEQRAELTGQEKTLADEIAGSVNSVPVDIIYEEIENLNLPDTYDGELMVTVLENEDALSLSISSEI
jgi:hypothetical protein